MYMVRSKIFKKRFLFGLTAPVAYRANTVYMSEIVYQIMFYTGWKCRLYSPNPWIISSLDLVYNLHFQPCVVHDLVCYFRHICIFAL